MAHSLHRFTQSILKEPQLITQDRYEFIYNYLSSREASDLALQNIKMFSGDGGRSEPSTSFVENGIGFLNVEGDLTSKPSGWEALCGGTNYPDLLSKTESLIKSGADTIVMQVDSGGGHAHLVFEYARNIRAKCDEANVKLLGYINGNSGSAAYVLTSVCHEVISNPTSKTGSIGCVVALMDQSKKLEQEGLKPVFITSTEGKAPYNEDGSFREGFLGDLKEDVIALHDGFVDHVHNFRGISKDTINQMNSKMFRSEVALENGLIDKIMEVEEFNNYLADLKDGETTSPQHTGTTSQQVAAKTNVAETQLNNKGKTTMSELTPELEAKLAKLAEIEEQLAAFQAKEVEAKTNKIKESLSAFTFLSEETQASLQGVLLQGGEQAELFNSVLDQATSGIDSAVEVAKAESAEKLAELSTQVEEANSQVETLTVEMDTVKKEFGSQKAVEGTVDKTKLTTGADEASKLAAKVAKKLSQKL